MSLSNNTKKEFGTIKIQNEKGIDMTNNKIRNLATPNSNTDAVNKSYVDSFRLIADLKWSIKNSDHYGWLICNGRSLNTNRYNDLFQVIGYSFGGSGGSFNLPDSRGRVLAGSGQGSGLTNRTIGQTTGEETHTMTITEMPSHTHSGTTDSSGSHSHSVTMAKDDGNSSNNVGQHPAGDATPPSDSYDIYTGVAGAHIHTFTTNSAGSGGAFNVMQPTIFIGNVFIFSGINV